MTNVIYKIELDNDLDWGFYVDIDTEPHKINQHEHNKDNNTIDNYNKFDNYDNFDNYYYNKPFGNLLKFWVGQYILSRIIQLIVKVFTTHN
jgi:hypothetical protein